MEVGRYHRDNVLKNSLLRSKHFCHGRLGTVQHMSLDEDSHVSFSPADDVQMGLYVSPRAFSPEQNYFEITIQGRGNAGTISLCMVPRWCLNSATSEFLKEFVAYRCLTGVLFNPNSIGRPYGPRCRIGDRVGCGIKMDARTLRKMAPNSKKSVQVFFTHNSKEIGTISVPFSKSSLYPVVTMTSEGESVLINQQRRTFYEPDVHIQMSIDSFSSNTGSKKEDWRRLADVRITSQHFIEYAGHGKSTTDVGLAQAKQSLDTTHHYFEIEIVDPGENCYIAIGLTRKDYPYRRHPGWNKGSIAYHADDGKIFMGCGIGEAFGPQCHKGDTMGCGILYPRDYNDNLSDHTHIPSRSPHSVHIEEDYIEDQPVSYLCGDESEFLELDGYHSDDDMTDSDSEDDLWSAKPSCGQHVKVFFTRNGKTIGHRPVQLPPSGFFPSVGMLSRKEKVSVNLRPLTG